MEGRDPDDDGIDVDDDDDIDISTITEVECNRLWLTGNVWRMHDLDERNIDGVISVVKQE